MHAYCLTRGLLFGVVPFGLIWTFAPSADPGCLGHAHQVHTALTLQVAVLNGLVLGLIFGAESWARLRALDPLAWAAGSFVFTVLAYTAGLTAHTLLRQLLIGAPLTPLSPLVHEALPLAIPLAAAVTWSTLFPHGSFDPRPNHSLLPILVPVLPVLIAGASLGGPSEALLLLARSLAFTLPLLALLVVVEALIRFASLPPQDLAPRRLNPSGTLHLQAH